MKLTYHNATLILILAGGLSGCRESLTERSEQALSTPILSIASAEILSGMTERDPVHWPVTDLFDGVNNGNDGYASDVDEDSGSIVFSFATSVDIAGFSLWNDFGTYDSQGASHFDLIFRDGSGREVGRVADLRADEALQMQGNGPDEFEFPEVRRVRTAEWVIHDNFNTGTGLPNSINLREVAFHGVVSEFIQATVESAQLDGLSVRNTWTADKLFDGATIASDGYHSNANEDSGTISFTLLKPSVVSQLRLWNDFGVNTSQGIALFDLELRDADGNLLKRVTDLQADPALQLQPHGPDVFEFGAVHDVVSIDVIVHDNFPNSGGIFNSLNVREIQFGTTRRQPTVTSVAPTNPTPGQPMTISGTNFGNYRNTNWINVASQPFNDFPTILSWSDTEIVAVLDEDLGGLADLSVVLEGIHSPSVDIEFGFNCSGPEFEGAIELESSLASIAYDVIRVDLCQSIVVGTATTPVGQQGFFKIIDESGASVAEAVYSDAAIEWRNVSRITDGFMLVGTSAAGDVVIHRVDVDGRDQSGWPNVYATQQFESVRSAVVTHAQIIVVGVSSNNNPPAEYGSNEESGFVYQFDLEASVRNTHLLPEELGGFKRALGVSKVLGGFVVVGDGAAFQAQSEQLLKRSWVARLTLDGETLDDEEVNVRRLRGVASWQDSEFVAVGESNGRGAMVVFGNPGLSEQGVSVTSVTSSALYDVTDAHTGFVAAGTGRGDGLMAQLNCAGGEDAMHRIDLGGDDRFEAIVPVFENGAVLGREIGLLAVGASNVEGADHAVVAWRHTVESQPTIISLTVNDEPAVEVGLGDTLSFDVDLENAWSYELKKQSGPGPDIYLGAQISDQPYTNTIDVVFDSEMLRNCADSGCESTTYELVATRFPRGRCAIGESRRATVTVKFALQPEWIQLVDSATSIRSKWATFGHGPHIFGAHPTGSGINRCLNGLGLPYATNHTIWGLADFTDPEGPQQPIVISDREPQLLLYAADDRGEPTSLVGYALGARLIYDRPIVEGDDWVPIEEWQGHWGGWHTAEGGMAIVVPTIHDEDQIQPPDVAATWLEPFIVPPPNCDPRENHCGVDRLPFIRHPALWDVHVFFSPAGGLPIIKFSTPEAGLENPCAAIDPTLNPPGLNGCDTGSSSLDLNPFFSVGPGYTPGERITPQQIETKECMTD